MNGLGEGEAIERGGFLVILALITIAMANNGPARCIQLRGLFGNLEMGNVSSNGSCVLTKF